MMLASVHMCTRDTKLLSLNVIHLTVVFEMPCTSQHQEGSSAVPCTHAMTVTSLQSCSVSTAPKFI